MSHTREQLEKVHQLLNQIQDLRSLKTNFLENEEQDLSTIPELITLIARRIENDGSLHSNGERLTEENQRNLDNTFKENLKSFFQKRWALIANGSLCYTRNINYPLNRACVLLAECVDLRNKNLILMPGVALEDDVYLVDLYKLEFGEFIIKDDKKGFIPIKDFLASTCTRLVKFEEPLYVTNSFNPLSQGELERLGGIIGVINSIKKLYQQLYQRDLNGNGSVLSELYLFRDALKRGDVRHGGVNLNAGPPANEGITRFSIIYNGLSDQDRQRLRNFHGRSPNKTIGSIIDRCFRGVNENYMDVKYCIDSIGRELDEILMENENVAIVLSGMRVSQAQMAKSLINLVTSRLTVDLTPDDANVERTSQLNPSLSLSETNWVVSFIAPKSPYNIGGFNIRTCSKIIVEGIKDGQLFVGTYYPIAQTKSTWRMIPGQLQNTAGIFSKIKIFESNGYAKIPQQDVNGEVVKNEEGDFSFKFDQLAELRNSLTRCHRVPVANARRMIKTIKEEGDQADLANWIVPVRVGQNTAEFVDALDSRRFNLFKPFERFGASSWFGSGKDNCVTWCERMLAQAGIGESRNSDVAKAKPIMHANKW